MEINQITKNSFYIPGHTNIGLFVEDHQAILIDSGIDESAGRRVYQIIKKKGWELKKIINTHSNADHIGGNAYLQRKTGCDILSTLIESVWIYETYLEPLLLWGAYPFKSLRNKFLQAQPSKVTHVIDMEGLIDDTPLQSVPLEGHFLQMIGIKTPDDVFFIADSLFSSDIISKYGLTVKTDVEKTLKTYTFLENTTAKFFIPSHAAPTENIISLIKINRNQIDQVNKKIVGYCQKAVSREDIIAFLVRDYQITLSSVQFVLIHITVSAHLSYLCDHHVIKPIFYDGRMLWKNSAEPCE